MAKILILDDEPANRYLVRSILTPAGHLVIEAADGVEALRLVRAEQPDLVIIDLFMPRISGTDFVRALRSDGAIAQTRLALYTGSPADDAMLDFMAMTQIAHLIPKPSEPAELARIVADACADVRA